MKKIILTLLLIICCTGCSFNESDECYNYDKFGVNSSKEIQYDIKDAKISLEGANVSNVTADNLNELKKYEISAHVDNNFVFQSHNYKGIKLKDFVTKYTNDNYNTITFTNDKDISIDIAKNNINDNMYLVFEKDDKELLKDVKVTYVDFGSLSYLWLYGVNKMSFVTRGEA